MFVTIGIIKNSDLFIGGYYTDLSAHRGFVRSSNSSMQCYTGEPDNNCHQTEALDFMEWNLLRTNLEAYDNSNIKFDESKEKVESG